MTPKKHKILEIVQESQEVKTLRVDFKGDYSPGQFFEIGLLGIGECPISVASDSREFVDFTIHKVGSVTDALHTLKVGDPIFLRGPFGNGYPLQEMRGHPLVLIGGGCGVAPMSGVLEFVKGHKKDFKEVKVCFGFKSVNELIYKKRLEDYKKDFSMNISFDTPDKNWRGFVGFITDLLKTEMIAKDSYCLVCGPPKMIDQVVSILSKKGIPEDRILFSLERKMQCGMGKCGHCRINEDYVCKNGPIFRYSKLKEMYD